jgi:hypothetical protein
MNQALATTPDLPEGIEAAAAFVAALIDAPLDSEVVIAFALGSVRVAFDDNAFDFSPSAAAKMADFLERRVGEFHGAREVSGFPNMILGLRAAVEKAGA